MVFLPSLRYAHALLASGAPDHRGRAERVLAQVLPSQDTDPTSPTYGISSYVLEEPLEAMDPPDWNWADFAGETLAAILLDFGNRLSEGMRATVRSALGHAAWSIFRRNVRSDYTNIAILGAAVTLAAGEILGEPRLITYGRKRLHDMVASVAYHGSFNEYNSPAYTIVALRALEYVLHFVSDPAAKQDAEELRRTARSVIGEHFHPATGQWAGPHSRAYSDWLQPVTARFLVKRTEAPILFRTGDGEAEDPSARDSAPPELSPALPCPAGRAANFHESPEGPYELRRRFIRGRGDAHSTWGTTWFSGDACLGSVNRDSLWVQRRPLLAYWRTDADPAVCLRARFLRDGRDFASAIIRSHQLGPRALSVVGARLGGGDYHLHLDAPPDSVFNAADFRLRCQLRGNGVRLENLDGGRTALIAGDWRAVIHAVPGRFGPRSVEWQTGTEKGTVFVDAVCYSGPEREFEFATLEQAWVVAGLELLRTDQSPAPESPLVRFAGEDRIAATWGVGEGLRIDAPLRAEAFEVPQSTLYRK